MGIGIAITIGHQIVRFPIAIPIPVCCGSADVRGSAGAMFYRNTKRQMIIAAIRLTISATSPDTTA